MSQNNPTGFADMQPAPNYSTLAQQAIDYSKTTAAGKQLGVQQYNPLQMLILQGQMGDMQARQQAISQGVDPNVFRHNDSWLQKSDPYVSAAVMAGAGGFAALGGGTAATAASTGTAAAPAATDATLATTAGGSSASGLGGASGAVGGGSTLAGTGLGGSTGAMGAGTGLGTVAGGGVAPAAAGGGFSGFGNTLSTALGNSGGVLGTGVSGATATGLAGLAYDVWKSNQDKQSGQDASQIAQPINQPQRQPFQNLANMYATGGQDITKQPIIASDLDYMNRQANAKLAQGGMSLSGNAPGTIMNYATESLNRTQQPYLNWLAGMGGYTQGTGNAGDLLAQGNNNSTNDIGFGLSNLFAGMNSAPGNQPKTNQGGNLGTQPQLNNSSSITGSNTELNV